MELTAVFYGYDRQKTAHCDPSERLKIQERFTSDDATSHSHLSQRLHALASAASFLRWTRYVSHDSVSSRLALPHLVAATSEGIEKCS